MGLGVCRSRSPAILCACGGPCCSWEPEAAWHESTWISQKQASFSSKGFGNGSLGSWSFNGNPHQIRKCCDSNHRMETQSFGDFWAKWVVVLKDFLSVTPTCKDQIWQPCFTNGWINHELANHVFFFLEHLNFDPWPSDDSRILWTNVSRIRKD